jgi:hypothetical protein
MKWELTPLSYIADYFVAVGEWLKSLGAADGMTFYSGSNTHYGEYTAILTEAVTTPKNRYRGSAKVVQWERRVYSAFPVPMPPLSLKPKSLNLSQLGNILAVMTTLFSGHSVPNSRGG